jgi:hypothetical protein
MTEEVPVYYKDGSYLNEATKALQDGRYGDVFAECRQALNTLYNGIDKWGDSQQLTIEEGTKIQNASGNEKVNVKRSTYFSKLVGHKEKGERINKLRNHVHQFQSLDPHSPDYVGLEFTRQDAIFVMTVTTSFAACAMKYISEYG